MSARQDVVFREEQSFRQPWLWALVAGGAVLTIARLVRMVRSSEGNPAGPAAALAAQAGLGSLLYVMKMVTEVGKEALYIRAEPIRLERHIPFRNIEFCEARTYNALLEYGGWGIRRGASGRAYNVSGNRGVQLQLASGERLLIGSQRAEELAEAIRSKMEK